MAPCDARHLMSVQAGRSLRHAAEGRFAALIGVEAVLIVVLCLAVLESGNEDWWVTGPVFVLLFSCLPSMVELARRSTGTWWDDD